MSSAVEPSPLRQTLCRPVLRSSLLVALVVGTVLNLINQGDALIHGASIHWLKVALTYCVPFCVSLFGAYSAIRARSGA